MGEAVAMAVDGVEAGVEVVAARAVEVGEAAWRTFRKGQVKKCQRLLDVLQRLRERLHAHVSPPRVVALDLPSCRRRASTGGCLAREWWKGWRRALTA